MTKFDGENFFSPYCIKFLMVMLLLILIFFLVSCQNPFSMREPEPPKDQYSHGPSKDAQDKLKSSDMDSTQLLKTAGGAALETSIDEQKKEEQKQKK